MTTTTQQETGGEMTHLEAVSYLRNCVHTRLQEQQNRRYTWIAVIITGAIVGTLLGLGMR